MQFNFILIPYRDQYFLENYGFIVRDLMIIKSLTDNELVSKVTVINRPVSIYERLFTKHKKTTNFFYANKLNFVDHTSFDLIGPLKKRKWTRYCYNGILAETVNKYKENDCINVLLDFSPIAEINYEIYEKDFFIWYDLIDNFSKHNRFDEKEKLMVKKKYDLVDQYASMITGVTTKSIEQFNNKNCFVVNNGLLDVEAKMNIDANDKCYKFGFLGFITNKLDIDFIEKLLRDTKEKIAIFGEVYDKKIEKVLKKNENIILFGKFKEKEINEIMSKFEIGLIPYKAELSHDESPLKLYQYIKYGKPVICTDIYEESISNNKYVLNIKKGNSAKVKNFLKMIEHEKAEDYQQFLKNVKSNILDEYMWSYKIKQILNEIKKIDAKKKN